MRHAFALTLAAAIGAAPPLSAAEGSLETAESEEEAVVDAAEEAAGSEAAETRTETVVEKTKHDVVPANTLWDLAEHYYRDPWLWPRIHEANKDRIKNPHWIYPGQEFVIPGLDRTVTVVQKTARKAPEEPQPPPEPVVPKEAPKPPVAPPALSEQLPDFEAPVESLSEDLPEGLVTHDRRLVPSDWSPDGVIDTKVDESLGIIGDLIEYKAKGPAPEVGARLVVYREGERKGSKGTYVQKVATIEVISVVDAIIGTKVRAEILSSADAVIEGDWVKKE